MTENSTKYEHDVLVDVNHVQVYESDIEAVDIYINRNREATQLPESIYSALAALVAAYKGKA